MVRRTNPSVVVLVEEVVVERPRAVVQCASLVANQNRRMVRWKSSPQKKEEEEEGLRDSLLGCTRRRRIYRFRCVHSHSSGKDNYLDGVVVVVHRDSWEGMGGRMGQSGLEARWVRLSEKVVVVVRGSMKSELQKEGDGRVGMGERGCGSCENGSKRVRSRIGDASKLREVVESSHQRISSRPKHRNQQPKNSI